jgi:beta-glucosidase
MEEKPANPRSSGGSHAAKPQANPRSSGGSHAAKPQAWEPALLPTNPGPAYQDVTLPVEKRVADLVARLTLEEKVSQMVHDAPAIERLGIPKYNWWSECLHGVARAGIATVFPQAIGLAATWNVDLLQRIAVAISDEARAKHHEAVRQGIRDIYKGLTFWSPNINIFRDPRWGRGQETYGEDPYLTARLGVAFVQGLQGDDPHYLKLVATPKHFAVHSGPEAERHRFDARVDERDLRETYLPAFEACIREGKAASVMGAYNRTNGEPCCASPTLLDKILRQEWGFDGYVVSDCWAIGDIYKHHKVVATVEEAAALAVQAGCDLNCGEAYSALLAAVAQGLIAEETIAQAVQRLFTARFRLGLFDPPEMVPYAQIPFAVNDSPAHRALALQAARESIVLLKNQNHCLPLRPDLQAIAVIGPNADDATVLLGNYHGTPSRSVTPRQGLQARVSPATAVLYAPGCDLLDENTASFAEAIALAERAEVVIFVGGISQQVEGEEGQREGVGSGLRSRGDRTDLTLPGVQEALLQALHATGKPVILVLLNGSALAVNWANAHLPAIVEAWYPGEEGGTALAEVLFGDYNPGGRLPVTFYKSLADLPPFEDYRMEGRTYRYFRGEPLFPFGYGLSYTTFAYSNLRLSARTIAPSETLTVSVDVQNVGERAGDEVVQLYVSDVAASVPVPIRQLGGFARIHLGPGEKQTVNFTLTPRQLSLIDDAGRRVIEPGEFQLAVGGRQPEPADLAAKSAAVLFGSFAVVGQVTAVSAVNE